MHRPCSCFRGVLQSASAVHSWQLSTALLTLPRPAPCHARLQRWFYVNATIRCGRIFEMYCARLGINLGAVKFMLRGERVFGASTPDSLNVSWSPWLGWSGC